MTTDAGAIHGFLPSLKPFYVKCRSAEALPQSNL